MLDGAAYSIKLCVWHVSVLALKVEVVVMECFVIDTL